MAQTRNRVADYIANAFLMSVLSVPRLLPYASRIRLAGWLTGNIVAPLAGYDRRVVQNLTKIFPDMPEAEKKRLSRRVPNNAGRTFMEIFSGDDFKARIATTPLSGPGIAALDEAHAAGRPIIVVSGHFGNYDAVRSSLAMRGHKVGGLYRVMENRYFNDYYVNKVKKIAEPAFERGRRGLAGMVRHLREGNTIAMLMDQNIGSGTDLEFMGKTARTTLSAADLALKFDALLLPAYGIRKADGISFDIVIEDPIPHSDPVTMMQAFNDSLEARVRDNMDQWLWIHRRWKQR